MFVSVTSTSSISRKYIVAVDVLSLVISTRRGSGLLHVTIDGSGSRPSRLMLGGTALELELTVLEPLLNKLGFAGTSTAGANWCCRLAYVSLEFFGGRGGSIGKNLKSTS